MLTRISHQFSTASADPGISTALPSNAACSHARLHRVATKTGERSGLDAIDENRFIEALAGRFDRSPHQLNRRQQSDAELVRLPDGRTLAVTTDSIAEEIVQGLYSDPYLIGWMTVMTNLSDLAAVGAEPLGIVISEILTESCTSEFLSRLHEGIDGACRMCRTFVLGGDTNLGERLNFTGTALGLCPEREFLTRTGCQAGDLFCMTNPAGRGNAFALLKLLAGPGSTIQTGIFRPVARLKQGQALRSAATGCIDTSDGVIAALDQMMRLNTIGFRFFPNWIESLDLCSRLIVMKEGIPEWLLLAGQHGEFELLFTIPSEKLADLSSHPDWIESRPVVLGEVIPEPEIAIPIHGECVALDSARIRNCAGRTNGHPQEYLEELLNIDREIKEGAHHACR